LCAVNQLPPKSLSRIGGQVQVRAPILDLRSSLSLYSFPLHSSWASAVIRQADRVGSLALYPWLLSRRSSRKSLIDLSQRLSCRISLFLSFFLSLSLSQTSLSSLSLSLSFSPLELHTRHHTSRGVTPLAHLFWMRLCLFPTLSRH
jgi:hypothetical protein